MGGGRGGGDGGKTERALARRLWGNRSAACARGLGLQACEEVGKFSGTRQALLGVPPALQQQKGEIVPVRGREEREEEAEQLH